MKVGLIGCGTVGREVANLLLEKEEIFLTFVVDKEVQKVSYFKELGIKTGTDANEVLTDDAVDVVIELIGGYEPARTIILTALRNDKSIVTANKEVLSKAWTDILLTAKFTNQVIGFEASVGGAIPVISTILNNLRGDRIDSIFALINGTSNYILTKMEAEGLEFLEALELAKKYGYAEADPRLDIEGYDSAHKLAILANTAFKGVCNFEDIYIEGIKEVTHRDIFYADELGYKIKLLAIAKRRDSLYELRVHPTIIPKAHILSTIEGVNNGVYIKAEYAGDVFLYGQGAGGKAAASAVVGDLYQLMHRKISPLLVAEEKLKPYPIQQLRTSYYLRFTAEDKPGVLAKIASVLGQKNISIASVIQKERGDVVPVVMLTHEAEEAAIREAVKLIDTLDVIKAKTVLIRIEELL